MQRWIRHHRLHHPVVEAIIVMDPLLDNKESLSANHNNNNNNKRNAMILMAGQQLQD
jgi:hypothetical protein